MATIHIHINGWNDKRHLTRLFESLRAQTFKDWKTLYIDNASLDGSLDLVREKFPEVTVLKNTNNLGSTGAHNQGFQLALSKWPVSDLPDRFVLILSPDMTLTPNFISELMRSAERHPEAGSFAGKILKMFATEGIDRELEQFDKSDIFDSAGLTRQPNGRVIFRGSNETDERQYPEGEIWGAPGAAVLLRASALEAVREGETVYDADFFSQGEDIDLAWRLKRGGWKSIFVPEAVAYRHCGDFQKKQKSERSELINFLSYRNHLLTLAKNLSFGEFFRTWYRLLPRELGIALRMLFFEPGTFFRAWRSFLRLLPRAFRKR